MIGFSGMGLGRKPKPFTYKPRHFDPEAQEKEQRRRVILGENYNDGEYQPGVLIREGRMRRMQHQSDTVNRRAKSTLIRTAIFFILVAAVLFFMSDIISAFLSK